SSYGLHAQPHLHSFPTRRSSDLKYLVRWHVPTGNNDLGDPSAVRLLHSYARRPTVCIESTMQLGRLVERELPQLTMPALIMQGRDRKSTRLNSSHLVISYAVFCL